MQIDKFVLARFVDYNCVEFILNYTFVNHFFLRECVWSGLYYKRKRDVIKYRVRHFSFNIFHHNVKRKENSIFKINWIWKDHNREFLKWLKWGIFRPIFKENFPRAGHFFWNLQCFWSIRYPMLTYSFKSYFEKNKNFMKNWKFPIFENLFFLGSIHWNNQARLLCNDLAMMTLINLAIPYIVNRLTESLVVVELRKPSLRYFQTDFLYMRTIKSPCCTWYHHAHRIVVPSCSFLESWTAYIFS